jgi:hypothetical protein
VRRVTRNAIVVALVSTVVAIGAIFCGFARPALLTSGSVTVKMATRHHYAPAVVRAAFAAQGIVLLRRNVTSDGTVNFSGAHRGHADDAFLVTLFGASAMVQFGNAAPKPLYDARFGNLNVTYGGINGAFLARVKAAVADITS